MSWLYSRALVGEYSGGISLDGAPSALWNGKLTPLPSWCNDRTMARCQLSQSGMTFKPLTASHGADVLMSFLAAFPAKTSHALEKARASKASGLPCGRTWRESLEKFDLDTHTWKTHQCLWDEDLQPSSVILPKWGMMRSGVLWERITLPPLTSGTGYGSWPTPSANEDAAGTPDGKMQWMLTQAAKSGCSTRNEYEKQKWPTPCTRDFKGANAVSSLTRKDGKSRMDKLPNAVKYITPRVGGEESLDSVEKHKGRKAAERHNTLASVEAIHGEQQSQLNPDWVEWLMGWPIGWTSIEAITELDWRDWSVDPADDDENHKYPTPDVRGFTNQGSMEMLASVISDKPEFDGMAFRAGRSKKDKVFPPQDATGEVEQRTGSIPRVSTGTKHRASRLKAIGNGQVPQVAAMAWRILSK